MSNGLTNPSSVALGTGSGVGKVQFSSISLTKQVDLATVKLMLACAQGNHIVKGTVVVREATGAETPKVYYQYDLTDVFIVSVSWGAATTETQKPSENLGLSFKKIEITYWSQDDRGSLGNKVVGGWDVSANVKI